MPEQPKIPVGDDEDPIPLPKDFKPFKYSYNIYLGDGLPEFTANPTHMEIIHRLILRAATAKDITEFNLLFCNC